MDGSQYFELCLVFQIQRVVPRGFLMGRSRCYFGCGSNGFNIEAGCWHSNGGFGWEWVLIFLWVRGEQWVGGVKLGSVEGILGVDP